MLEHLLIYVLVAFSIHRLWIYEDIFITPRAWARSMNIRMLWCAACFAFWASLLALPSFWYPEYFLPLVGFAAIRLFLLFGPKQIPSTGRTGWGKKKTETVPAPADHPAGLDRYISTTAPQTDPPPEPTLLERAAIPESGCPSCDEKAKIKAPLPMPRAHSKHLIIMTALQDFDPSYSLVTVIMDQCRAALKAGFYVELWGMDQMRINKLPEDLVAALKEKKSFNCQGVIPHVGWLEDKTTPEKEQAVHAALSARLRSLKFVPTIITHDFVFQSWYLTIAKVMHQFADVPVGATEWIHQIHSSVGDRPPEEIAKWRATIPKGHKIAAVNYSDIPHLIKYYQATSDDFVTIKNTRDIRTFMNMPPFATQILEATQMHRREIVQVYPLSTPRMMAKGIQQVISTFAALKRQGADVFLLIENAHATGEDGIARMQEVKQHAEEEGLTGNMAFTSDLLPSTASIGLTENVTRSLFTVSNVFCFPSVSEACGLVMLEAALAGNLLVLNASLPVLTDFLPHKYAMYVPWGSSRQPAAPVDYDALAASIRDELNQNRMNIAKRRVMMDFSIDALADSLNDLFDPES
jgi:glycosyltransferase involved in cell wall biosynthesis